MLLAIANASKFAQICLKLSKIAQKQLVQETLKFQQKFRFWIFAKKASMNRGGTKACACRLDF
jgi:hypothetical protein